MELLCSCHGVPEPEILLSLLGNLSCKPCWSQGTGGGSTMSLRVWRGCHQGGELAIGIACDRSPIWNQWPEHTRTAHHHHLDKALDQANTLTHKFKQTDSSFLNMLLNDFVVIANLHPVIYQDGSRGVAHPLHIPFPDALYFKQSP